jgi:glycosyltransferase involved in cell wall biosynthesis
MQKKKILFLIPLPPPEYGASISSKTILESKILNENFEIRHVRLNYSEKFEDIGKLNIKKFLGFFIVNFQVLKNLIVFRPNLVYFTIAPLGLGFLRDSSFALLCKIFRKKILFHIRGKGIKEEIKNPIKKILYKIIFKDTKSIILAENLYDDVKDIIRRKDIFILPNAISNHITSQILETIIQKRRKRKIPNILFLSNLDETKGPLILLKACKILKDKKIKFKCNFVGAFNDEKFKKRFLNEILNYNLDDSVNCLGPKKDMEKNKILADSDILAFPTYYRLETFGRVIIEAMQYGIPVIANGIASIPSIIVHGKTGFILKKNTPEELAEYLRFLIKNKDKAINLGINGYKRFLKNYCFSDYEPKLKGILEKNML